jgi:hypothetical protein
MFKPHDTGSGKTHTMLGSTRQDSASYHGEAGIIPQAVADLFSQLEIVSSRNGFGEKWRMILSYIEVYNEQVYDLLESSGKVLSIREDQERGVVTIAGANEQEVNSYDEVIELLVLGNRNRRTESTNANNVSSRSHAVLQLTIQHYTRTSSGRDSVIESKLSLIDLAGSERASATNNRGVRLQEGANINKSLLSLANCINALSSYSNGSSSRKNVKYRDSKLTHLLKSSLEGNCNLVMIANVNPSHMTYEDSHNTLKYANRAKSLKVSPVARESIKDGGNWIEREAKLKEENMHLRRRVAELELLVEALQAGMDMEEDTAPTQTLSIPRNQKSESVGCYKGNHHQTLLPIDEEAIECNKSNSLCTTEESMEDIAAASSDKMDDKDSFDTHIARVGETYNNETRNILSDSALEAGLFDDDDAPTPIKSLDGESETYLPCPLSNKRPLLNEANLLDSQLVHTQSKKSRRESLIPKTSCEDQTRSCSLLQKDREHYRL